MPTPRLPSARAYLAAFDGWILTSTDELPTQITGWTASSPAHLRLSIGGSQAGRAVQIDMRTDRPLPPHLLAIELAFWELQGRRRFPIELRFERERLLIPVEGRKRRFTAVTSESWVAASARLGGHFIEISGARERVEALSLRKLSERELRILLKDHRDRFRTD